ncbi:tetratricopeptide repeat protein [Roseomonas sp. BN140053]|uniref:tetratricopeptide repeat protein n=1 Tax=Roseomonas sp. BN140053 TaxID=3391898 RepID=UPI0039EAB8C8
MTEMDTVLDARPGDAAALADLAATQLRRNNPGDAATAEQAARAALALRPDLFGAWNTLGHALARRHAWSEAVDAAREAVRLRPEDPGLLAGLAGHLLAANRVAESAEVLSQAVALRPEDAGLHRRLSITLSRLGRGEDALAAARRAVELRPEEPDLHLHLATLLAAAEPDAADAARAEAERLLRDALDGQPEQAGLWNLLAKVRGARRDPAGAVAALDEVIRLEPASPWPLNDRVGHLLALNRLDEALVSITRALELRPEDPVLLRRLAIVLDRMGRPEEAVSAARRAVAAAPGDAENHHVLAGLTLRSDPAAAAAAAREAVRLSNGVEAHRKRLDAALARLEAAPAPTAQAQAPTAAVAQAQAPAARAPVAQAPVARTPSAAASAKAPSTARKPAPATAAEAKPDRRKLKKQAASERSRPPSKGRR